MIKIGSYVIVIDDGGMYTTYTEMANKLKLTNYRYSEQYCIGDLNGMKAVVIGREGNIIAIKEVGTGYEYLIELRGLIHTENPYALPQHLFDFD